MVMQPYRPPSTKQLLIRPKGQSWIWQLCYFRWSLCKSYRTRTEIIVTGGMSGTEGHSSWPLILFLEISWNIRKDGTSTILIALAIWASSYRELARRDSFMPLVFKKSGATTKKNDGCRVKELLEMRQDVFWRQKYDVPSIKTRLKMWEGACPRWRWVS